jgi:hypothetical protein
MSRSERRTRAQVAAVSDAMTSMPLEEWLEMPLVGFGIAQVPGSMKWFAFKLMSGGARESFTPLYDGKLRGESKAAATGRLKNALLRAVGGLDV